jgi:hypothetical protein
MGKKTVKNVGQKKKEKGDFLQPPNNDPTNN